MKYKLKSKLNDKGFPVHTRFYKEAHEHADKLEKSRFPKDYEKMKKVDSKLKKHELAGKNFKSGKIEVSKKVPAKYRTEVAFHERTENLTIKKMMKKRR